MGPPNSWDPRGLGGTGRIVQETERGSQVDATARAAGTWGASAGWAPTLRSPQEGRKRSGAGITVEKLHPSGRDSCSCPGGSQRGSPAIPGLIPSLVAVPPLALPTGALVPGPLCVLGLPQRGLAPVAAPGDLEGSDPPGLLLLALLEANWVPQEDQGCSPHTPHFGAQTQVLDWSLTHPLAGLNR